LSQDLANREANKLGIAIGLIFAATVVITEKKCSRKGQDRAYFAKYRPLYRPAAVDDKPHSIRPLLFLPP